MTLLDEILTKLRKLNKSELEKIGHVLASLLAEKSSRESELWFEAICASLGVKYHKKTWLGGAKAVAAEKFLDEVMPDKNKLRRAVARKLLVNLLVADLVGRRVNPTVGIVASNLGRLPEVFDGRHGFPGYRASGLASLVFNRKGKK